MKNKTCRKNHRSGIALMAGVAALAMGATVQAQTTYTWEPVSGGWSTATAWAPDGVPGAADSITLVDNGTGTINMSIETNRTVDVISKTGSRRWDIQNNQATQATLTANTILGTTNNMVFRNGAGGGGMAVVTGNLSVTGFITAFGSTDNQAHNYINAVTVTGTSSVTGTLLMNIQNASTSNAYSLGLLNVSGTGIVSLANRAAGSTVSALANTTGLVGTGGTIRATSTAGLSAVNANLVITNTANYSSGTVILDGTTSSATVTLTKAGSGTQVLTGSSTYTGGTVIEDGMLSMGAGGSTGSIAGNVAITGSNGRFAINRSSSGTFAGVISGNGGFVKQGSGTWTLSGSNSYAGGTTIENGRIRIASDENLGAASGSVTFAAGAPSSSALEFTAPVTSSRNIIINADIVRLSTEDTDGETGGLNTTTLHGVISGTGGVDKRFVGTLILTAENTYTGATVISGGTLVVNGGLASSGVTVTAAGALAGSGTLAGPVTVDGKIAADGDPATLTINNALTLNDTAQVAFELGGTGVGQFDRIALDGALTMNGTLAISLVNGFNPTAGNSFDLFSGWTGEIVDGGYAFDFTGAVLGEGLAWDTTDFLSTGSISVVPEPTTWALLGLGAGLMLWRGRKTGRK